jgi:hypothetical protein
MNLYTVRCLAICKATIINAARHKEIMRCMRWHEERPNFWTLKERLDFAERQSQGH